MWQRLSFTPCLPSSNQFPKAIRVDASRSTDADVVSVVIHGLNRLASAGVKFCYPLLACAATSSWYLCQLTPFR